MLDDAPHERPLTGQRFPKKTVRIAAVLSDYLLESLQMLRRNGRNPSRNRVVAGMK